MQQKLAIVTTHPIQYFAPIFKLLNAEEEIAVKVFYTYEKVEEVFDEGFGKKFKWDIPLLDGYDYTFVSNNGNTKKDFWSVKNPTLIKEIEDWGATAVLVYGWNFFSHLKAIKYFKGKITVLFRGDSTLLNQQAGVKSLVRKMFLSWIYASVDYALYVGSENKEYYKFCGMKDKQLIFAPHSIDNDRFNNLSKENADFIETTKKNLGINPSDIVLIYCAKFQAVKNPFLLIDAFKKVENLQVKLIMVGNGELENELKLKAANDKRILFLPFQNQSFMPAVYRLGDLFVLSSISETWGLAVNEAMACKLAILVSNKCGCAIDLVKPEKNGEIFISNNEDDLVNKINLLVKDKLALKQMGQISEQLIFDWSFQKQVLAIKTILA